MRIAILGGGVAGVVLAREFARLPQSRITLYEANPLLGGLHRTETIGDLNYDIGSFLFDHEHELLKTFPFLYDHFIKVNHRALVVTQSGSFDVYPMSLRGYLRDHGIASVTTDTLNLLASKIRHRRRNSLVSYVSYYLGERVYHKSGLKAYVERFYATRDTDVDIEFAIQRLASLPEECGLRRNILRIAREYFNRGLTDRVWECYVRPKEGFPLVYRLIQENLRASGVDIHTGCRVEHIERDGEGFLLKAAERDTERFDIVVSTIPIGTMLRIIGQPTEKPPETIRLVSLCYRFHGDLGFSRANLLYNFTHDAKWKRLNLHSPLYGKENGDDYFSVECTHRIGTEESERSYRKDFEEHIKRLPILKGTLRYQGAIHTNDAYPFFRRSDIERNEQSRRTLEEFGIALSGRQGRFVYSNAHTTAVAAKALARKLSEELT